LNRNGKERWQINKIEGGVMCTNMEFDLLGVGYSADDANELPVNWTAGL
jgi:hypothetical protein